MVRQSRLLRRVGAIIVAVGLAMPLMMSSGTSANAAPVGKGGPLTPRLQLLADPAFGRLPSQVQAEMLMLPASGPGSIMERPGARILVDVRVTDTGAATIDALRATGLLLVYVDDPLRIITAEVLPSQLTALAAVQPQVLSVQEVLQPGTSAACPSGDFVSEGDIQLNAATGRTHYSVDGTGITVGILSDSYDYLGGAPADVANGELPGAANPCGYAHTVAVQADDGTADEGRAMTQIVHDLAPGADLRFATANNGEQAFASQIRDLATAGADVIVDDITYFAEPMYQDGVVGKAVEDVVAAGVTYFSSAGNENSIIGGNNVASYEAQAFRPTACPASVVTYEGSPVGLVCHDFNPAVAIDNTYGITINGSALYVLGWNEPQFGIATDLDFCVLNHSTGAVIACSAADSILTQKAFEAWSISGSGSADLVVARYAGTGTPRFKTISWRSALTAVEYATGSGGDVVGPTTFGHNASRSGATVAAIPYNNASTLETFSSRGPATYCWGPVDGTTPAAPLSPCETATVDMSATDGVVNSFFGSGSPHRFYGTSAAAPHAAAISALVLEQAPCLTPAQVLAAMETTALPVGAFGADAKGAGRLDADAAIGAAGSCGVPTVTSVTPPGGPAGGGTTVTIGGTGFTGATVVAFGATAAAGFSVDSDTSITATSPAGSGTVHVTVTTPGGTSVTSSADQFTYVAQVGFLRVTSSPALPTQISIDGVIADSWGLNWLKLAPGSYTVSFSHIEGFTEPAPQVVIVTAGATTTVTGTFTARGTLRVITDPAVAGRIVVDGVPRNQWGLWTDLPAGVHQVCFGPVAGFDPPACEDVTLTAGVLSPVTGTYTANAAAPGATGVGFLRVTSDPAVRTQISIDGVIADSWGLTWVELAPGPHTVSFSHVEGFTEPAPVVVTVTDGAITTLAGTFVARGSLRVITSPAVAGTITVDGIPRNDWGMWTDLPVGMHTVCFGAVPGFTAPACQNPTLTAGALSTVTGTYTP